MIHPLSFSLLAGGRQMQIKQDEVVNAVRYQLGIPVDGNNLYYGALWEQLSTSNEAGVREVLVRSARFLEKVVRFKLGLSGAIPADEATQYEAFWQLVVKWLSDQPIKRSPLVSGLIKDAITSDLGSQSGAQPKRPTTPTPPPRNPAAPPPPQRPPAQPQATATPKAQPTAPPRPQPPIPPPPPPALPPHVAPIADAPTQENNVANTPARITGPQWKYIP